MYNLELFDNVIPAEVKRDVSLPPNAKLIYGEIYTMASHYEEGYASISNADLANLYGVQKNTVTRIISLLVEKGLVKNEVIRDTANQVIERRLYPL